MEISGGPPPGGARLIRIDWGGRRIAVASAGQNRGGSRGAMDLVARWVLPLIARSERATLPVHATSLLWEGRALVLLGPSGVGKSTTAAAACAAGARLLGDEPVLLDLGPGDVVVWPGEALLRLTDEARSLVGDAVDLTPVGQVDGKTVLHAIPPEIGSKAIPLLAVCCLVRRQSTAPGPVVEPMDPTSRLMALAGNGYARAGSPQVARSDFALAAELANRVPVVTVAMPEGSKDLRPDAAALPALVRRLIEI